jgi:hypothetical protein
MPSITLHYTMVRYACHDHRGSHHSFRDLRPRNTRSGASSWLLPLSAAAIGMTRLVGAQARDREASIGSLPRGACAVKVARPHRHPPGPLPSAAPGCGPQGIVITLCARCLLTGRGTECGRDKRTMAVWRADVDCGPAVHVAKIRVKPPDGGVWMAHLRVEMLRQLGRSAQS